MQPGKEGGDWHHSNSIQYNKDLDQIILSVPHFDEIWIIDHNLSTEEAASEKGDFMFRWDNPQAYKKGAFEDQQFFSQHNAQWIPEGLPDEGQLLVFNNGQNRFGGEYTSVVKLSPTFSNSKYQKSANGIFLLGRYHPLPSL